MGSLHKLHSALQVLAVVFAEATHVPMVLGFFEGFFQGYKFFSGLFDWVCSDWFTQIFSLICHRLVGSFRCFRFFYSALKVLAVVFAETTLGDELPGKLVKRALEFFTRKYEARLSRPLTPQKKSYATFTKYLYTLYQVLYEQKY
jgi:hypothetical protein